MDYPFSSSSRFDASGPPDEDEQPGEGGGGVVEREHMFDKVVTPSDVGKLNRLVIPKQHAEKYFPLDSSRDEKGLLLNFEDRTGKAWRFRYSYWNSSQSYVMTKGWSRFVKEKKLDAGDIVSFHRGVAPVDGGDKNTPTSFFIDWRRRRMLPEVPLLQFSIRPPPPPSAFILRSSSNTRTHQYMLHHSHPYRHPHPAATAAAAGVVWDHIGGTPSYLPPMNVNVNVVRSTMLPSSVPQQYWTRTSTVNYFSSSPSSSAASAVADLRHISSPSSDPDHQGVQHRGEAGSGERMVFDSVPVVQGKAAGKRLRLFGVNMDCPNNYNNNISRDYDYYHHHNHHDQDDYSSTSITTIPASSASSSSPHDRLLFHHHDHHHHHHQANHEDPLPLQLRLPVDKGKLSSSSSSSMSLDLDM